MKVCYKCKIEKEPSEFYKSATHTDGLIHSCRTCMSAYRKAAYAPKTVTLFEMPIDEGEIWKEINAQPKYFISNKGRVYSSHLHNGVQGALIKHRLGFDYPSVTTTLKGKQKDFFIHRLIAEHFIPNPDNKPFVNHINSNIFDFSVGNLEWVYNRENQSHGYNKKNVSSKYTGVHWAKHCNKWIASFGIDNKRMHLGCFTNEEDAAQAYKNELEKRGLTNKYVTI